MVWTQKCDPTPPEYPLFCVSLVMQSDPWCVTQTAGEVLRAAKNSPHHCSSLRLDLSPLLIWPVASLGFVAALT